MPSRPLRRGRLFAAVALSATALSAVGLVQSGPAGANPNHRATSQTTSKTASYKPPKIGHVWTIILENKSYEATFTGLNQNSYLWKTLPSYGELLRQYYGTGHYSLDNYISLVSGQAPAPGPAWRRCPARHSSGPRRPPGPRPPGRTR